MNKEKILKFSKKGIQFLMLFQIIISIIFMIKNINYMPKYGDTKDFLELSQTLQLPSYRPFVYPVTLNITGKIAELFSLNITYITYFFQIIISLFACLVAINTIKQVFNIRLSKKETIGYALFIISIPFNMHFNMSIKCDSLATSFTILCICYIIQYCKTQKYRFAIYSIITMFLAASTRSERIYFLAFVLVATMIIETLIYFYSRKVEKWNGKKIVILGIILLVGITTTNMVKGIFQNEEDNSETSESTIFLYAYERIVGNTLPTIYEYLPDDVKQDVSYEEAIASTVNGNTYKLPYLKLLEKDGNLQRVNKIIKVAVRRNFPQIAMNIMADFLKNMFAPYYIIFDTADEMYLYTLDKMEGEHPFFADVYVLYFNMIFSFITAYLIFNRMEQKLKVNREVMIILFYAIVSAGFFSLLTGFNFHIRYVMPVYMLEIVIITVLFNRKSEEQEMRVRETKRNNRRVTGNL